jgi:hypothetical protein
MTTVIVLTVIGATIILLFLRISRQQFNWRIAAEQCSLASSTHQWVGPEHLNAHWCHLPEPVQRYFRYAISARAPAIRMAHLTHGGLFRTKPDQEWQAIKGEEYFAVAKPEFIWRATTQPAPFLSIMARDRLLSGCGNMLVKLNSVFTIVNASGPEVDQGATLRWLAEAIWFPYGFVADCVRWDAIDERSACATLIQQEKSVKAIFQFDEDGKLTTIRADRYRDLGSGRFVLTPWTGECSEYREFSGFRIPTFVDVGWQTEQHRFSYARFQVTDVEYNVSG